MTQFPSAGNLNALPGPGGVGRLPRLSRWWLDRPVRVKGLLVLALPMTAFIAVTGAGLGLQLQEQSQRQVATAASALTGRASLVLTDAVNAESGVRGFAATRNEAVLTPYLEALRRAPGDVAALRAATSTAGQRAEVDAIAGTLASELAELATLRSAASLAAASPRDLNSPVVAQKVVMDRLRGEVGALAGEAAQRVAGKSAAIDRLEGLIEVTELVGLGLGLLAALTGAVLHGAGLSRRIRLSADNAERLGKSVALQTATVADDEFGRLDSALARADLLLTTRLGDVRSARDHALLATQAKNMFLSHTSHELRTPLNAILGFAQLLEMSNLDHDDRDSAQRILVGGRHLLALISELLDTALVETGELKMAMETVAADVIADDVATLMQPLAAAGGITIALHHAMGSLAVHADDLRLRQVLVNLLSNAIKYNHRGGTVTIACQPAEGSQISVAVCDTGPGLSPEAIKRVFIPFDRLGADQTGVEGTGIGLPLALALTEAMGGVLEVESTPGHGSTFTVRLPRAIPHPVQTDRAAASPGAATASGAPTDPAPLAVLSIEDNPANALVLSRMFRNQPGATLYSASTGQAGIDLAHEHHPDVILLDLNLPDLPGDQVLDHLHADAATADTPVIVLSADATARSIRRVLRRGASGYLTKPVDLRELRELIEEVVTSNRPAATANDPYKTLNTLPR